MSLAEGGGVSSVPSATFASPFKGEKIRSPRHYKKECRDDRKYGVSRCPEVDDSAIMFNCMKDGSCKAEGRLKDCQEMT